MLTAVIICALAAAAIICGRRQVRTLAEDIATLEVRLSDHRARVALFDELDAERAAALELDRHCLEIGVRPAVTAHLGEHLWVKSTVVAVDELDGDMHPVTLRLEPGSAVCFDADGLEVRTPPSLGTHTLQVDCSHRPDLGTPAWLVFTANDEGRRRRFTMANIEYGHGGFPRLVAEVAPT